MKWHSVALRVVIALVPLLVEALRDGRLTASEREALAGLLVEALAREARRP